MMLKSLKLANTETTATMETMVKMMEIMMVAQDLEQTGTKAKAQVHGSLLVTKGKRCPMRFFD